MVKMKKGARCVRTVLVVVSTLALSPAVTAAAGEAMAHGRFDDGTGNLVTDSSGNGNAGTIEDIKWVQGAMNSAGELGWEAGVNVGNDDSLNAGKVISIQA